MYILLSNCINLGYASKAAALSPPHEDLAMKTRFRWLEDMPQQKDGRQWEISISSSSWLEMIKLQYTFSGPVTRLLRWVCESQTLIVRLETLLVYGHPTMRSAKELLQFSWRPQVTTRIRWRQMGHDLALVRQTGDTYFDAISSVIPLRPACLKNKDSCALREALIIGHYFAKETFFDASNFMSP